MNFRRVSDTEVLMLAKTIEDALVNHRIEAFDAAFADEMAVAIGAVNSSLEGSISNVVRLDSAKQAAVAAKSADSEMAREYISVILSTLKAKRASAADYEMMGFDPPKRSHSMVVAYDPSDLAAEGASNNVNRLAFRGNNRSGRVKYEIWRRDGKDGEWKLIGHTGAQRYIDDPVIPGQRYEYKTRARAARTVSNYSNMAVVYGTP